MLILDAILSSDPWISLGLSCKEDLILVECPCCHHYLCFWCMEQASTIFIIGFGFYGFQTIKYFELIWLVKVHSLPNSISIIHHTLVKVCHPLLLNRIHSLLKPISTKVWKIGFILRVIIERIQLIAIFHLSHLNFKLCYRWILDERTIFSYSPLTFDAWN